MKPKTMVLLVLAVTCGLGASYMTSRLLAERTQEAPETVRVLVARKDLATGSSIKNPQELFVPKEFVRGTEPKDAIESFDNLKGRILRQRLREGDHVRPEDLMSEKDSLMQANLPPGHRAIGLRVSIESIAGGFAALPMSHVDIISTVRKNDDKSTHSTTLLQNVLVLAADQTTVADGKSAMPATTVTVALKPEDVQKVTLASQIGTLSLALRPFNETTKVDVAKTTAESLYGGSRPEGIEGPPLSVKPDIAPAVKPEPMPEPEPEVRVAVVSSANPSVYGQAVTFTATVTGIAKEAPLGLVMFKDGDTVLGTGKLELLGGEYKATFTPKTPLRMGPRAIIAVYEDDSLTSSTILTQDVKYVSVVMNGTKLLRWEFTLDKNNNVISSRVLSQDGAVVPSESINGQPRVEAPAPPPVNPAVPPRPTPEVLPGQATPVPPSFF